MHSRNGADDSHRLVLFLLLCIRKHIFSCGVGNWFKRGAEVIDINIISAQFLLLKKRFHYYTECRVIS